MGMQKTWFAIWAILLIAGWLMAGHIEMFELVFNFSRAHETWDIDEVFSFMILLGLALPVILTISNTKLRKSLLARQKAEERAQHIARHDPLTGLHNRRAMAEIMRERIKDAEGGGGALSILLMDLDRFKPINDLRGHDVGDQILQEVARRLKTVCQWGQVPVRLGGDEFAVVIPENENFDAATGLARRILSALKTKFQIGGGEITVGTSVGIAVWSPGIDEEQLFRHADQAMYRAKREGRGRLNFFDDDLGERLREEAELEVELTEAIEAEEIVPYFQPIVDISERRLVGFEVLARWKHPRLGQVPPTRFIALAEDTGQINAISWLILRQACNTVREWPEELSISFNLSPRQFRDSELAETISAVLRNTSFPPERLEIEITESAVIEDLGYARETIERLRWIGIRISLDDFGTGFSGLATLSRLPFDKLKIDRSFVTQVTKDAQKAKIVAGIISLADTLDLSVTAEGIETEETYELLADLNCELGQGFLFERPLPGAEISELLKSGQLGGELGCSGGSTLRSLPVAS
ncbi:putative bifunctional diguanylate cyclase/phosphodiesterase [Aliiruegeria lutimaris]|uniref:Diguanylate cyclase (GGDEF) domain-containing protein n=1 Tax=Aliiruegeria lutimaris TaxID=571298 RepID=A0A1G8U0T6_9RHOB|nr:EAL domain-containing protein [Aliiruegeria lutimaris]SDJ47382.1 diguanylate cyclase (GGDEF) domain-containing protein [Aliiruegeria lutimaris]